jgi:hypothetical protein
MAALKLPRVLAVSSPNSAQAAKKPLAGADGEAGVSPKAGRFATAARAMAHASGSAVA